MVLDVIYGRVYPISIGDVQCAAGYTNLELGIEI